jgi:N-acetyl-gamma-glutamyl-phosphate reductase
MINVAIIGANGYTAFEAIKILLRHQNATITMLTGRGDNLGPVSDVFPALTGLLDLELVAFNVDAVASNADIALCCLPHKASMAVVAPLIANGVKVVDLSADYRFDCVDLYESVYQVTHTDPKNLATKIYGLPELFRNEIANKQLIANPGCYPTAATLALAPLLKEGLISPNDIIVNAVSGASGAGRKPTLPFHFPEMNENLFAYGVGTHRHGPEIEQSLTKLAGENINIIFQPHVVNIDRGILQTIYTKPHKQLSQTDLNDLYQTAYSHETFVRLFNVPPKLKDVQHTNFCDICPLIVGDKIVIFANEDNLIKGASGQAVQNMNIICGLDESMGLL